MQWHEVSTTVRGILDTEWTTAPVAYQNEAFTAPDGEPWLYFEVLPISSEATLFSSTGLRIRRAEGMLVGHVFVPTGTGSALCMELAEQFGGLLELRTISAGVETGGYELAGATSSDDEGNYFRASVTVPVAIHTTT